MCCVFSRVQGDLEEQPDPAATGGTFNMPAAGRPSERSECQWGGRQIGRGAGEAARADLDHDFFLVPAEPQVRSARSCGRGKEPQPEKGSKVEHDFIHSDFNCKSASAAPTLNKSTADGCLGDAGDADLIPSSIASSSTADQKSHF